MNIKKSSNFILVILCFMHTSIYGAEAAAEPLRGRQEDKVLSLEEIAAKKQQKHVTLVKKK